MEELFDHATAMDFLWAEVAPLQVPKSPPKRAERRFPPEGGWYWVCLDDGEEKSISDPVTVTWLDGRFRVVERVYRALGLLAPRLRTAGDSVEPRGIEMWEWNCIGLHRLWRGWSAPGGLVRADLRPALFDVIGEGDFESETLLDYEIYYPPDRVEAVAAALKAAPRRRWRALWHRTLADGAARAALGPKQRPADLLNALVADGLAQRKGARVSVCTSDGAQANVDASTFRRAARRALDRQLFERFV